MLHNETETLTPPDLFAIGRVVSRRYTFTAENIKAYAEMAGDTNPLHHDAEIANASRFGGIIAAAAHSTGVLISVAADKFAKNGESVGLGFDLTLRRAVKAGTETDLIWEITSNDWSEKLKGYVVELAGEIRDINTDLPLLLANGRMLVLDDRYVQPIGADKQTDKAST